MPREEYQAQLDDLRTDVVEMADLVLDQHETALRATETGNSELATRVIEGDGEINELYLDLESECARLLALQQPVAGDLRLITASFKILTDLERIGDLAVNLAEYALDIEHMSDSAVDPVGLGAETARMVEDAIDAYEHDDAEAARTVAARDDEIDRRCEAASSAVVEELLRTEYDDEAFDAVLADVSRLLLTIRDLERVADHAVNVCARTVYMTDHDDELLY